MISLIAKVIKALLHISFSMIKFSLDEPLPAVTVAFKPSVFVEMLSEDVLSEHPEKTKMEITHIKINGSFFIVALFSLSDCIVFASRICKAVRLYFLRQR